MYWGAAPRGSAAEKLIFFLNVCLGLYCFKIWLDTLNGVHVFTQRLHTADAPGPCKVAFGFWCVCVGISSSLPTVWIIILNKNK